MTRELLPLTLTLTLTFAAAIVAASAACSADPLKGLTPGTGAEVPMLRSSG